MSTDPLEILLAQLFSSPSEVELFLQDRATYARNRGLTGAHIGEILKIDSAALRFAAGAFERKRGSRNKNP